MENMHSGAHYVILSLPTQSHGYHKSAFWFPLLLVLVLVLVLLLLPLPLPSLLLPLCHHSHCC